MLPAEYLNADVRNVTPVCLDRMRIGVGFDVGALPVRVALDLAGAKCLRTLLDDYINSFARTHSEGSQLIPSEPKSVPSGGVNV